MEQITIKVFDDALSAHILKARIESEGIPCFIHDENMVTMNPLASIALGGVKLRVWEVDAERALQIIEEIDRTAVVDENGDEIYCPNCESNDYYRGFKSMSKVKGILSMAISFFLIVFPIYYKTVKRCKNCETEF